jgi:hypothetical protein
VEPGYVSSGQAEMLSKNLQIAGDNHNPVNHLTAVCRGLGLVNRKCALIAVLYHCTQGQQERSAVFVLRNLAQFIAGDVEIKSCYFIEDVKRQDSLGE